ncbi:MarR family winged helix-turn-helix transcriptional regulator [Agrobacterium pusense]|uniref:Transcriptional regulator n=1 Tax=Agrobacterium pusense TaxID=648995 RepID=U4QFR3_9HYPH|nr:MarR family transcriptional regulator [Agrobacterium pusense]CDI12335.1 Transcriptional regulator [Agrobacterium pusense]
MNREKRQKRLDVALGRMLKNAEDALERAARQGKMHPTDLRCLSLLASSPAPMSPRDIVSRLGLTSGSGTALFDRLERLGFTRRIPNCDDRRSVLIELDRTAASEPLALLVELRDRYRKVTQRFSDDKLDVISEYLEEVSKLTPFSDGSQS